MKFFVMNKSTITQLTILSIASALISSCALDPNYRAYQQQQATSAANADVAAPTTANPYGVPQSSGEVGTYTPATSAAPYQPLPGVAQTSTPSYTPAPTYVSPSPAAPTLSGNSYEVVAGDSLWALSRKFGTTVEAIQAANAMTTTTIRTGQALIIPGN